MTEDQEKARAILVDLIKIITTLSSATLVLSTTLLDKVLQPPVDVPVLLWISWACLAVSVVAGLFTLGVLVGNVAEGKGDPQELVTVWYSRVHFYGFAAGLLVLSLFVALNTDQIYEEEPHGTSTPAVPEKTVVPEQ